MSRVLLAALLVASCAGDPPADPIELAQCRPPEWTGGSGDWGAPCRSADDCPDTGYPTTFCEPSTGGYCTELSGPDFAGEGLPCASDANSVGFTVGSFQKCLAACTNDSDCRPGYACARGLGTAGTGRACLAIADCESSGCNDAGTHYCNDGACWLDRCIGDPCSGDDFSTGICLRTGDARTCTCVAGEYWDPDCQRCGGLECDAADLGVVTTTVDVHRNTCEGLSHFDPSSAGCTGYAALGPEMTLQFTLPPATGAVITATPVDSFDLSLYVLDDCFDFTGATCLFGEDAAGAEVATVANDSDTEHTYVAVVDGAQSTSCGITQIAVEPFPFQCRATDLGTFTGTPIVLSSENNCADDSMYNPGLAGCTGAHATGRENIYRLTLAPGTDATVTMDPSGFDAELWQTRRCGDYGGAECTTGSGAGGPGAPEAVTLSNPDSVPATHFIVADSFNVFAACGTYELRVE